ncbi:MAG TPA: ROK family protein [Sphingomonadaceae bacterium]|nr:ROK family protein [Sphingomonadaceae bacterium]
MSEATEPRLAGLELGGTKCVAVVGNGERIQERRILHTTSPRETLGAALSAIEKWHAQEPIEAIGIASFGPIRVNPATPDFGTILNTPKAGWAGVRLLELVRARFACPVGLDTDVNGAALAEQAHGAARNCSNLVYLTIGTGLGGGVVIGGRPVHGRMHPEIGHVRLRRVAGDSFAGVCPFHGDCIEGLIAGPALEARLPAHPRDVAQDDPAWGPVFQDLAELLGHLMLTLSPEKIVVGGGVTARQPHLLERARTLLPILLADYLGPLTSTEMDVLVCSPALGDDAGPVGALVLASRALTNSRL